MNDELIQTPIITLDYELLPDGMKEQKLIFGSFDLTKVHSESLIKLTSTRRDVFSFEVSEAALFGEKFLEDNIDAIIDTSSELIQVPNDMFRKIENLVLSENKLAGFV